MIKCAHDTFARGAELLGGQIEIQEVPGFRQPRQSKHARQKLASLATELRQNLDRGMFELKAILGVVRCTRFDPRVSLQISQQRLYDKNADVALT